MFLEIYLPAKFSPDQTQLNQLIKHFRNVIITERCVGSPGTELGTSVLYGHCLFKVFNTLPPAGGAPTESGSLALPVLCVSLI